MLAMLLPLTLILCDSPGVFTTNSSCCLTQFAFLVLETEKVLIIYQHGIYYSNLYHILAEFRLAPYLHHKPPEGRTVSFTPLQSVPPSRVLPKCSS